jgi:hypothetical protein
MRILSGAPFVEEALKLSSVAIIAGISPCLMNRPLAPIVCGMLSGLGFSHLENTKKSFRPLHDAYELFQFNGRAADYHPLWDAAAWVINRGIATTPWLHGKMGRLAGSSKSILRTMPASNWIRCSLALIQLRLPKRWPVTPV